MNRVLFKIGSVSIYWYSVIMLIAILIGYGIVIEYSKKIAYKTSAFADMFFYLIVWAIIGARGYYVIFNFDLYRGNLLEIFMVWKGGLAIYGGVIAGIIYIFYYCLKHKLNFIKVLDIYSLSLLLGQAIGRWGNFFNQEAYGGIVSLEYLEGLHLPKFIIEGMYIDGFYRNPTFLYESIWCLIGVVILARIRKRYSDQVGRQVYFYLAWYGLGRFFIEGLRTDSLYIGSFRVSQIVSVVMFVIGVLGRLFIFWKNRKSYSKEVVGYDGRL